MEIHAASKARGRYARLCVQIDISKPLVTTVRMGDRHQIVIYEGINSLCFSCGRIGHRKENCYYTIQRPSSLTNLDAKLNDKTFERCTDSPHPKTDISSQPQPDAQGKAKAASDEIAFGPWMVVSRKRKGPKATKESLGNPVTKLGHASLHISQKWTFECGGEVSDTAGPSHAKNYEGKRKAHAELDFLVGLVLNAMNKSVNGSESKGPVQTDFYTTGPLGQFNNGLDQAKSTANLVRGK